MASGFSFTGKGSWFGGPRDSMDSGKMAGGNTTALPAVAVRLPGKSWRDSRKYLNKYVRVTAPNGRTAVYRVGDLGPNESTGRNVDITYSGLKRLGYTEGNFPTDAKFKVEYIGDKPDQPVAGRGLKAVKGVKAKTTETFDAEGYDSARRKAIGMQLLAQKNPNSILVKTGVLDATPPDPEDFKIAQRSTKTRAATRGTDAKPPRPQRGAGASAKEQGLSPLLEMFYDPQGGFDNNSHSWDGVRKIPAIGGHDDHVHVAAGPKTLARLDKRAKKFGLVVSSANRPGAVTSSGNTSFHASGRARDYAGSPKQMAAFTRYMRRLYKTG